MANTSAGAPSLICCASADEPAKLNVHRDAGCSASKSLPSSVNASVSEAAAQHGEGRRPRWLRRRRRRRRIAASGPTARTARASAARPPHAGCSSTTTLVALTTTTASTPGARLELVGRLSTHQRHEPMRAGLHLDLGHHLVLDHLGDDRRHPVAGRLADRQLGVVGLALFLQEPGQVGAIDEPLTAARAPSPDPPGVSPPPHRIDAHP